MSFDDRLRASLDAAGGSVDPVQPPVSELVGRAHRRRRAFLATGGAGAVAVIALVGALLATSTDGKPTTRLGAAGRNATTTTSAAASTQTTETTPTTSATAIGPSGSVVAPPASTVVPRNTTTTTRPAITTTTTPASTGDVVVTQDDAGKTFTLRRGQRLVVTLQDSGWDYSEPETDNASALSKVSGHADPATGDATATFVGAAAGQAHVSASKDAPCRKSSPPCMVPTYLFQVTVNVL